MNSWKHRFIFLKSNLIPSILRHIYTMIPVSRRTTASACHTILVHASSFSSLCISHTFYTLQRWLIMIPFDLKYLKSCNYPVFQGFINPSSKSSFLYVFYHTGKKSEKQTKWYCDSIFLDVLVKTISFICICKLTLPFEKWLLINVSAKTMESKR